VIPPANTLYNDTIDYYVIAVVEQQILAASPRTRGCGATSHATPKGAELPGLHERGAS
jgi:hypothetical protein